MHHLTTFWYCTFYLTPNCFVAKLVSYYNMKTQVTTCPIISEGRRHFLNIGHLAIYSHQHLSRQPQKENSLISYIHPDVIISPSIC